MDLRKHAATSQLIRIALKNSSTGAPLTGLTEASAGLIVGTVAENESATTRYRASSSEIETITTLGTYAAPTSGKCRFKEVDSTNHPGLYEIQLADARFAVASARRLVVSLSGAASLLATDYEIRLVQFDPDDAVRLGLTALPNAAAEASGGLPTLSAAQASNGTVNVNVHRWLTGTPNALQSGRVDSYLGAVASGVIAAASFASGALDAVWSTAARTLTAFSFSVDLSAGAVSAIWDKATSALTTAGSIGKLLVDRIDAAISSRSTYDGSDTSGTTTLLGRLTSTRAGNLDNLDTTVSSRSSHSAADVWSVGTRTLTAFSFAVDISAAAVTLIWDKATSALTTVGSIGKLLVDNINATVSSRAPETGGNVAAIKAKTDNLPSSPAATGDAMTLTSGERTTLAGVIWDRLTSAITTAGSIGKLLKDNIDATISSRSSHTAADVWAVGTRTLTSFGTLVSDIWAGVVDSSGVTTLLARLTNTRAGNLDNLDAAVSTRSTPAQVKTQADQALADVGVTSTVTGRVDAAVSTRATPAQVKTEADQALTDAGYTNTRAAKLDALPARLRKNTAFPNFHFLMVDAADHLTGKEGLTVTANRVLDNGAIEPCENTPVEIGSGLYAIDFDTADVNADIASYLFTAPGADARIVTAVLQEAA